MTDSLDKIFYSIGKSFSWMEMEDPNTEGHKQVGQASKQLDRHPEETDIRIVWSILPKTSI